MSNYEKSVRTFVAYQGREFSNLNIVARLNRDCPSGYTVKSSTKPNDGVVFAKIVYDNYVDNANSIFDYVNRIDNKEFTLERVEESPKVYRR